MTDFGAIKGWVDTQEKLVGKSHPEVRGSLDELLDATLDETATREELEELTDETAKLEELDWLLDAGVKDEALPELDPPPEPPQLISRLVVPNIINAFIIFITKFSILNLCKFITGTDQPETHS